MKFDYENIYWSLAFPSSVNMAYFNDALIWSIYPKRWSPVRVKYRRDSWDLTDTKVQNVYVWGTSVDSWVVSTGIDQDTDVRILQLNRIILL